MIARAERGKQGGRQMERGQQKGPKATTGKPPSSFSPPPTIGWEQGEKGGGVTQKTPIIMTRVPPNPPRRGCMTFTNQSDKPLLNED